MENLFGENEPFNLAGELIDNGLTNEGENRVRYLAHVEALKAQTHYDYARQCWIENGRVAKCGHRAKERGCYTCNHAGEIAECLNDCNCKTAEAASFPAFGQDWINRPRKVYPLHDDTNENAL